MLALILEMAYAVNIEYSWARLSNKFLSKFEARVEGIVKFQIACQKRRVNVRGVIPIFVQSRSRQTQSLMPVAQCDGKEPCKLCVNAVMNCVFDVSKDRRHDKGDATEAVSRKRDKHLLKT